MPNGCFKEMPPNEPIGSPTQTPELCNKRCKVSQEHKEDDNPGGDNTGAVASKLSPCDLLWRALNK